MGSAVVLGQLASSSVFAGVDSAAHMAEEVSTSVHRRIEILVLTNGLGQRRLAYCSSHDDADYRHQRRTWFRGDNHILLHYRGHREADPEWRPKLSVYRDLGGSPR
jgi:hypothetical protein